MQSLTGATSTGVPAALAYFEGEIIMLLMANIPQPPQNSKMPNVSGKASVHGGGMQGSFGTGRTREEFRLFNGRERDDEPLAAVVLHVGVRWTM